MSSIAQTPPVAVSFVNERGEMLAGLLHGGELNPSDAAVVCCHGMFSSKEGEKHALLASSLTGRVAVLRFDFAGQGESEGRLFDMTYSSRIVDLQAAIEYLAGRGVTRFGLFGSSMGGAVALLAAARDERICAVATLAAVAHPLGLLERDPEAIQSLATRGYIDSPHGRLGPAIVEDARQHDVVAAVRVLRAPVLVLHSEDDAVVPVADAHDIAAAARNVSLELSATAGHEYRNPLHLRPAMQGIASFLLRHLAPPA